MRQVLVAAAATAATVSAAMLLCDFGAADAFMLAAAPLSSSPPTAAPLSRSDIANARASQQFAASGVFSARLAGVMAAVAAAAIVNRLSARVQMRRHRRNSWTEVQQKDWMWTRLHPPKTISKQDLKMQETKAQLLQRDDVWATEWCVFVDPRTEEFQFSEEKTRAIMEDPEYESPELERQKLGLPNAPFTLMDMAMQKMRGGGASSSAGGGSSSLPKRLDKKPTSQKELDTRNLELEFVNFKGYDITKAQRAKLEARGRKK